MPHPCPITLHTHPRERRPAPGMPTSILPSSTTSPAAACSHVRLWWSGVRARRGSVSQWWRRGGCGGWCQWTQNRSNRKATGAQLLSGSSLVSCCVFLQCLCVSVICLKEARADGLPHRVMRAMGCTVQRITANIADVCPQRIPMLQNTQWLALGKHLCGAATDLALRATAAGS